MKMKSFLKFVEIQTKLASMISFALGTVFALYWFGSFDTKNFLYMFLSLLSFDMTTTAINNYIDYKRARKKSGYGYEEHNAMVRDNIRESAAVAVILVLFTVAIGSGFLLFLNTNVVVLLLGVVSFGIGVLYSAGPVPISRTPFGEVFSGLFMGFFIPFLAVFIHVVDKNILVISLKNAMITFQMNIFAVFSVFLCSVPAIIGIANIMLANNICDMEDDLENNRYTLPLYIGKKKALILFKLLYYVAYAVVIPAIIFGVLPITALLVFITLNPVRKNIQIFSKNQTKQETFGLSVKNFTMMNAALILTILMGFGLKILFKQ